MKFDRFEKFNVSDNNLNLPTITEETRSKYYQGHEGSNCFQLCDMYAAEYPDDLALVSGYLVALMVDKQKGIKVKDALMWNTPYGSHTWLIDKEGNIYDPALENLVLYTNEEANMAAMVADASELVGINADSSQR